jgi:hypothetical protein
MISYIGLSRDCNRSQAMRVRPWILFVAAMPSFAISGQLASPTGALSSGAERPQAISDVYIEQARGRVRETDKSDAKVPVKPTPEAAIGSSNVGQMVPATCNAQNSSSQACYTATQQARPATR